jgi:hypothetical protein
VTIYSSANYYKNGLPGVKHAGFVGIIFVDHLQFTILGPHHFISFRLTPGRHVITASLSSKHSEAGKPLEVDVAANQHYFVRTTIETPKNPFSIAFVGIAEQVGCPIAQKEASQTRPEKSKNVKPDGAPYVISEIVFPQCP